MPLVTRTSPRLAELLDLLSLERIEKTRFVGQSQDLGWGLVYGGQVVGQALSAASQTVPEDRFVHSLHSYFLRPGDASQPVTYIVERIRDGRSFTTRRVVAFQQEAPIFTLSCSFQVSEPGFSHQAEMPDAPPPETLLSTVDLAKGRLDEIPEALRPLVLADRPIEIRPVQPRNLIRPEIRPPRRLAWYRCRGALPDTPSVHQFLLAYASDFSFLTTALQPHGVSLVSPGMHVASLDHAVWFHQPFRLDTWLLHVIDSPSASGARGLVRGQFFTTDGRLVASTTQEGLIRRWPRTT